MLVEQSVQWAHQACPSTCTGEKCAPLINHLDGVSGRSMRCTGLHACKCHLCGQSQAEQHSSPAK